jgi:hypothetical protein
MPTWFSMQGPWKGGTRFKANGQPPAGAGFQPNVASADVANLRAPMEYQGLRVGPELEIQYEANQAPPLDGNKDLLRTLSPFIIQMEPPLIATGLDPNKSKQDIAALLQAGHSGAPAAFSAARNRIRADIAGGPQVSYTGSVESFISNGRLNRPDGGSSGQTVAVKPKGGMLNGRLGTPAIADLDTAVDITMQLRALVQTPPLVLLINPQTLSMSYSKIQQFTDRTRYGFIFQAWGEEQPRLSISARCGAFVAGGKGVQFASRLDSAAWQNVQTMFHFYKHNGYIYDTVGKSNAHHMVGALSIHYDGWVYYGNLESFTYTLEEGNQLGGIVFDMEFTVNAMVDTSKSSLVVTPMKSPIPSRSDPRYYGQENRAAPSAGDISVGLDGEVVRGGHNFYTKNKYEQGAGQSPDGQPAVVVKGSGAAVRSAKGTGGFVRVGG